MPTIAPFALSCIPRRRSPWPRLRSFSFGLEPLLPFWRSVRSSVTGTLLYLLALRLPAASASLRASCFSLNSLPAASLPARLQRILTD
jgi:hypothetical protein